MALFSILKRQAGRQDISPTGALGSVAPFSPWRRCRARKRRWVNGAGRGTHVGAIQSVR
jgi:hypothetical protein